MMHSPKQFAVAPQPVPDAEALQPAPDSTSPADSTAKGPSGNGRRRLATLSALVLVVVLASTGIMWGYFHATHVVSRNALVRAHVSELGVRQGGVVQTVHVDAGDRVVEGQLLAQLADQHLLARRAASEAAVAKLNERIALARSELVFDTQKAQAELARAIAEHQRMSAEAEAAELRAQDAAAFHAARRALAGRGGVSAETIRDAAAKAATAESLATAASAAEAGALAERDASQLALDSLALREAQLRVLQSTRQEAEAELAQVEADIESTRVYAPAAGAVIRRLAQPGMAVDTGTPILSLWLTDRTWIEAWVPEEELAAVAPGNPVQVSFPAVPGERFAGVVSQIGLATDFEMPADYLPQTRESRMRPTPQVGVEIRLDAPPAAFLPGMSAVVDIRREAG